MVALASALRLLTLLGFLSPPAWAAANCTFVQDVDYAGGLAGSSCNPVVHTPGGQQECCDACDACPECVRGIFFGAVSGLNAALKSASLSTCMSARRPRPIGVPLTAQRLVALSLSAIAAAFAVPDSTI